MQGRHCLVAVVLLVYSCPQVRAESLEEAWAGALAADQRLEAARYQTEAARWEHSAAQGAYLPKVTNQTGYSFLSDAPSIRLDVPALPVSPLVAPVAEDQFALSSTKVTMPIYTGGRITSAVSAAACGISAAEKDERRTALDVKLDVVESYTGVLRAQRAVEVAEANVRSLEAHSRVVGTMFREGLAAKNDWLAAEVALADARQRAIQARNRLDIARAAYNRLLGRPLTQPVGLEEVRAQPDGRELDGLVATALDTRPELARLAAQANALRRQAESVRAGTRPQLGVDGGFTYLENRHVVPEGYWSLTLALEWTPYDGGISRARGNALRQKANAVARLRADAVTRVTLDVRKAWLDVDETCQRVDVTSKAIDQAEENLRVAKARFEQGQGTNTEVLDAEALRTLSFGNYYNAVYDSVLGAFRLQRAIGTL